MSPRVLIIDDDPDIAKLASLHLSADGFEVCLAADGTSGLKEFHRGVDLVLLDLGLPDMDGLEVCKRMRELDSSLPILLLTARGDESDRVLGLEIGADDYLTKPVGYRELVARVRAHLRRVSAMSETKSPASTVAVGSLVMDPRRRRARYAGNNLTLTAREYDLLLLFAQNMGVVYTRSDLLDKVWGTAYAGYEHTVNSHINRLRGKLSALGAEKDLVETVWGVGYRYKEEEL
ncbi:MAG: two-component system OmpR family response regulator [Planctomycetota bacterium]|jgi:two-component system OmpR family response regulator